MSRASESESTTNPGREGGVGWFYTHAADDCIVYACLPYRTWWKWNGGGAGGPSRLDLGVSAQLEVATTCGGRSEERNATKAQR